MAGESYYQLGQLKPALDSYNAALKLYLAYSDWMMRVQFPPAIMPAQAGVIRQSSVGTKPPRNPRRGSFPKPF